MTVEIIDNVSQDTLAAARGRSAGRGQPQARGSRVKPPKADSGPIKAFGYVRVSSHEQSRHGLGLDVQREALQDFCQKRGWALVAIFEDPGVSGATADEEEMVVNRTGLQKMLRAIDGESIRLIVVLNTSRLWRSDAVRFIVQRELRKLGVDVKSIEQPTYSIHKQEPNAYLVNAMQEVLDSYMRLEIVTKLARGRLAAARKGQFPGGGVAYGYLNVRGSKALTINKEEAEIVRLIFRLHRNGRTAYRIARVLNEKGIRTRKRREWTHRQVSRILVRKRFYQGKVLTYGGVEAKSQQPTILLPPGDRPR